MILVLNTNYWSKKAYDFTSKITLIGDKQMSWLNTELEMAKNHSYKVIIVGHIPPGYDKRVKYHFFFYAFVTFCLVKYLITDINLLVPGIH